MMCCDMIYDMIRYDMIYLFIYLQHAPLHLVTLHA